MSLVERGEATETWSILYPNGQRELSLRERTFAVGDVLRRDNRTWIVVRVDDREGRAGTVVVMPGHSDRTGVG